MGYSTNTYVVAAEPAFRLCAERTRTGRVARVTNDGPATVWLADDGVQPDRGFRLEPGADPYVFAQPDALYAITRAGTAQVTVIEEDSA